MNEQSIRRGESLGSSYRVRVLLNSFCIALLMSYSFAFGQNMEEEISLPNLQMLPKLGWNASFAANGLTAAWEKPNNSGLILISFKDNHPRVISEVQFPERMDVFELDALGETILGAGLHGKLWLYDIAADTWSEKWEFNFLDYENINSVNAIKYFAGSEGWLVQLSNYREGSGPLFLADENLASPRLVRDGVTWVEPNRRSASFYVVSDEKLELLKYSSLGFESVWESESLVERPTGALSGSGNTLGMKYAGALFGNGEYLFICPSHYEGRQAWMVFSTTDGTLLGHGASLVDLSRNEPSDGCVSNGFESNQFMIDGARGMDPSEPSLPPIPDKHLNFAVVGKSQSGEFTVLQEIARPPDLTYFNKNIFLENGTIAVRERLRILDGEQYELIPRSLDTRPIDSVTFSEHQDRFAITLSNASSYYGFEPERSNAFEFDIDSGSLLETVICCDIDVSKAVLHDGVNWDELTENIRPEAGYTLSSFQVKFAELSNRLVVWNNHWMSMYSNGVPIVTHVFDRQRALGSRGGKESTKELNPHEINLSIEVSPDEESYFWCDRGAGVITRSTFDGAYEIDRLSIHNTLQKDIFPDLEDPNYVWHKYYRCADARVSLNGAQQKVVSWSTEDNVLTVKSGDTAHEIPVDFSFPLFTLSADGSLAALSENHGDKIVILNLNSGEVVSEVVAKGHVTHSVFNSENSELLVLSGLDVSPASFNQLSVFDVSSGELLAAREVNEDVFGKMFVSDQKDFIAVATKSEGVSFYDRRDLDQIATLRFFGVNDWAVTTSSGLYDASLPGDMPQLSWVFQNDRLTPLPLETFFRDYYTPGLLGKLLRRAELPELASIADIDRTLPELEIISITPDGDGAVQVTVAGTSVASDFNQGTFTGIEGLRLSRDGQMVGEALVGDAAIRSETGGVHEITFENIQLPTTKEASNVEFSAYAFSQAGIKSLTVRSTHEVPASSAPTRRAHVLTMGVDAYDDPAWTLKYAAADARAYADRFSAGLEVDGAPITDISVVRLVSDETAEEGEAAATSANLEAALRVLAGGTASQEELERIPGLSDLSRATPDDVVILAFSGHGFAAEDGQFYFFGADIPSDNGREITPELLDAAISSTELRAWVSAIDAGQFVMIIDACNSGASVAGLGGFRPGPLGSRDFGQLAYDKRMTVLAASSAESVALESEEIGHGLLTYALLLEGADDGLADAGSKDGEISLQEMLEYGRERVPELYEEISTGTYVSETRAAAPIYADYRTDGQANGTFQPVMFDFSEQELERVSFSQH